MASVDLYAELMQPGEVPSPLPDFLQRPDWQKVAACTGLPREWWFPIPGRGGCFERARGADALAICETCQVRAQCLARALEGGHEGIWGGTTTAERKAMTQAA